jgi:hypothetical protein
MKRASPHQRSFRSSSFDLSALAVRIRNALNILFIFFPELGPASISEKLLSRERENHTLRGRSFSGCGNALGFGVFKKF